MHGKGYFAWPDGRKYKGDVINYMYYFSTNTT